MCKSCLLGVISGIFGQFPVTTIITAERGEVKTKAYKLYKRGKSLEIVDPTLASSGDPEQVAMCIQIGLLCTQSDPQLRPTMRRVVVMMSKKLGTLEEPTRPGYAGSRYKRSHRHNASSSSTAGTSGQSNSHSISSTNSTTATATSTLTNPRLDPRGKRPVEG